MPVDNELYDRLSDTWWDEAGFLYVLKALNPARFGYMRRILVEELKVDPRGKRVLDIGCGGGLLSEELARLGCDVTGIDLSQASLDAARDHVRQSALTIDYQLARAESLPFPDATFDVAYCCDVLEHVDDVAAAVAEAARVLKPGGVYLFDTINRKARSWLIAIKIFQEWSWTSFMPSNLHDWRKFIKPKELVKVLVSNGLEPRGLSGLAPTVSPLRAFAILRARKRGELTYTAAVDRLHLRETDDMSVSYLGHAMKL